MVILAESKQQLSYMLKRLGEKVLVLQFPQELTKEITVQIQFYHDLFKSHPLEGILQVIPAMNTLSIRYNPLIITETAIEEFLNSNQSNEKMEDFGSPKKIYVPIVFGGKYSPDLKEVSEILKIKEKKIIDEIVGQEFYVYLNGFIAGFPYMGEINSDLSLPRKKVPRLQVPAGSVAIANNMCTIYTVESPGGWNLIGWTPMNIFDFSVSPPNRVNVGDYICYKLITSTEAENWDENMQKEWDQQWNQ